MIYNIIKSLVLLILLSASWCSKPPEHGVKKVIFKAHDNINNKFALRVHIVQIYDQNLFNNLKNTSTQTFVKQKKQLLLDNSESLKAWEFDLLNNDSPKCFILPHKSRYWGIIIFIEFVDSTENKIVYPPETKELELLFENGSFTVTNTESTRRHHKSKHKQYKDKYCTLLGKSEGEEENE